MSEEGKRLSLQVESKRMKSRKPGKGFKFLETYWRVRT
jgi:hypothetical protein